MKITIIIPVYNVAPYIDDCLKSVMAQTYDGPMECLLIDDCGTDDSIARAEALLKTYQGSIDFRILHHDRNRGLSAARNTGITAASGEYVYFLDSDDEITADCMAQLAQPLQTQELDLVVGGYRIVGSDRQMAPLSLPDGTLLEGRDVLRAYRRHLWYMMSVNKLYRHEFLEENGLRFRAGIIHEDELWSFQVACLAQSLKAVSAVTYLYKIRQGSITVHRDMERRCHSLNTILGDMDVFLQEHRLTNNRDAHQVMEVFRIICLYSVYQEDPARFHSFYADQREIVTITWPHCCRMNGLSLPKQVRDFHLALPIRLAEWWLKAYFIIMPKA